MNRGLGLVLLLALGCATPRAEQPLDDEVDLARYLPLGAGAEWTYAVRYPGQQGEMTVRLTGQTDGYWNDDRGGAWRLTPDGLRDKVRYLVRRPVRAGTQWRTVLGPSAVEQAQIISVGEPCEARAGRFPRCLVVHAWVKQSEAMTLHIEWTFAQDVGLVRLETEAELRGKGRVPQVAQDLLRWKLAGGASGGTASAAPSPGASPAPGDDGPPTWSPP